MSPSSLIARGVGFSPGSVSYIPTLGLTVGVASGPSEVIPATWSSERPAGATWSSERPATGGWSP